MNGDNEMCYEGKFIRITLNDDGELLFSISLFFAISKKMVLSLLYITHNLFLSLNARKICSI